MGLFTPTGNLTKEQEKKLIESYKKSTPNAPKTVTKWEQNRINAEAARKAELERKKKEAAEAAKANQARIGEAFKKGQEASNKTVSDFNARLQPYKDKVEASKKDYQKAIDTYTNAVKNKTGIEAAREALDKAKQAQDSALKEAKDFQYKTATQSHQDYFAKLREADAKATQLMKSNGYSYEEASKIAKKEVDYALSYAERQFRQSIKGMPLQDQLGVVRERANKSVAELLGYDYEDRTRLIMENRAKDKTNDQAIADLYKDFAGVRIKDENGELRTVNRIDVNNGIPQFVFNDGTTTRADFDTNKFYVAAPADEYDFGSGIDFAAKNIDKIIKTANGMELPVVSSRPLTSDISYMTSGDEVVDPNKFGSIYTLADGSQYVAYTKDLLEGKNNVIKGGHVFSPNTELLNKNKDKIIAGSGDFDGTIFVPYSGESAIFKTARGYGNSSGSREVDSGLLGKTIVRPDGSFGTVTNTIQPTFYGGLYGNSNGDGALRLDFGDGKMFGFYDEKTVKGERRSGGDGSTYYSDYLLNNQGKASVIDLSGVGDELLSGTGSKGLIVPLEVGADGKVPAYFNRIDVQMPRKKGGLFGGFVGDILGDVGKLFSNPVVQLGVSAFVPGGAALVAGYNAGNAFAQGGLSAAVKAGAIGYVAGQAGNLAGQAASNALGASAGGIVGKTLSGAAQGAAEGVTGAALTGGDIGKGITAGIIGGAAGGAANSIVGQLFPDVTVAPDNDDIAVDTPDGGAGFDPAPKNPFGDLGLPTTSLIGDKPISGVGLGFNNNFTPTPVDPLNPDFSNLGGTFNSQPGLNANNPNTPMLGGNGQGTGLTIPIFDNQGQQQGFQGSQGGINTNPNFGTTLTDLANNNLGAGSVVTPQTPATPVNPVNQVVDKIGEGVKQTAANTLKNLLSNLLTQTGNNLLGGSSGNNSNPLTQNPASGNNTGANMADYTGLIGNILGQNTQINRLEETANQLGGQYQNAAANLNKPFTPYNVTSGAGSTTVQGQNITSQLSQPQQQLANVAGQAAGMFGDVNVPGVEGIRNSALSGAQGLLSQAQGFNPQQAAAQEFSALQELYAPQRERDRLAMENRLRAQGRLGASDNPALRQLEESFRQQDLQGAIQSRNLGFQRQQELQNLAQGMFTTGSQAAQLPTQIQAQRAQIGAQGAQASQLPFQTLNQQQQAANQLSQTQSTQGTALANIMAQLQDKGFATQGGLLSQAAALKNARDVAALQGLFGGGGVGQGAVGGAVNNAIGGIVNPIGNAIGGALTGGLNAIGGAIGNLFSSPQTSQPALNFGGNFAPNGGLTSEQLNAMSDDDFIDFLLGR